MLLTLDYLKRWILTWLLMFFAHKLRYQGQFGLLNHILDSQIATIKNYFVIYTPPYSVCVYIYIYKYSYE